ncbi:MAG: FecR domain-containing protein [Chloroflexi bacterium]|nr:FecR domain-containing protein [Chloroflexota bacterium]
MKKNPILLLVLLAAFAVLAGCQTEEASTSLSATLSELSGLVEMKQAEQDAFAPAAQSAVLDVNGQIQTGDDGRARLDLSSGTIIRVAPSSLFTLTSNDEVEGGLLTKIKLEAGKIFIVLNGGQADVETPSGVASVRGSYLKVEVDPITKDIYITCLEGTCSATGPNGEQIIFTDGQKVTLFHQNEDGTWDSPLLGPMTLEDFEEWLENNNDGETKKYYDEGVAKLLEATDTPTEAPTEEPTDVPPTEIDSAGGQGDSSNACSQLQEPANGGTLGKIGQVKFAWSEQPNAQTYVLTFVKEDGTTAKIMTDTNSAEFYIEVLPAGGDYQWFVTAYGADGSELCTSTSSTFSKPKADPTEKAKPEKDPNKLEPGATEDPNCSIDPCSSPSCAGYDPYYCGGY